MSDQTYDPEESGFDARLRALASRLLHQHGCDPSRRDQHQDDLFRAMQTFAVIKEMTGTSDDMARCEAMGAMKVRFMTEPAEAP